MCVDSVSFISLKHNIVLGKTEHLLLGVLFGHQLTSLPWADWKNSQVSSLAGQGLDERERQLQTKVLT